jgi:hypothetical protein
MEVAKWGASGRNGASTMNKGVRSLREEKANAFFGF